MHGLKIRLKIVSNLWIQFSSVRKSSNLFSRQLMNALLMRYTTITYSTHVLGSTIFQLYLVRIGEKECVQGLFRTEKVTKEKYGNREWRDYILQLMDKTS